MTSPTNPTDGSELKPCPFCGKPPHFTPRQGSFAAYVACVNESCGIQPESGSMDPAYAKARWNTRVQALSSKNELASEIEGLREAIERALAHRYGDWTAILDAALNPKDTGR
jgi:hypothetical protein